jgi:predicted phosphohydrolase
MKLRYFSDLHLEFIKPKDLERYIEKIPSGMDEICILAGDIGNPYQANYDRFMEFISQHFKHAFVIPGNHEYYFHSINETNSFLTFYFQKFDNICLLNNSYEHYEGCCFVGTTLWSHVTNPSYKINDVYRIIDFDYIQYNRLNRMSVDFLEDALDKNENIIVITHHVPSSSLIDMKYLTPAMRPYNQWFYCDLDELIVSKKRKITAWFYGHTHTPSATTLHGIPFLCNPMGYPGENRFLDFQKNIVL